MADQYTGWLCTHTASVISTTDTTATIRVYGYWKNNEWSYDIGHVYSWVYCNGVEKQIMAGGNVDSTGGTYDEYKYRSIELGYADFTIAKTTGTQDISCYAKITSKSSYTPGTRNSTKTTISVSAITSYAISYNANGGTEAPASQTKWHNTTLTLSATKPTRNGYSFEGWATSSTGSVAYYPGSYYTNNAKATLYAVWKANTYIVSYNSNGGSGAPTNQTKTYGQTLTIASTIPVRTNYNFLGWATSSSATIPEYYAGGRYDDNSAITLYAVWELTYVKPRISIPSISRCNSDGTPNEEGIYASISFDWVCEYSIQSATITWYSGEQITNKSITGLTGTSGRVENYIFGDGAFDPDNSYRIEIVVSDTIGQNTRSTTLGAIKYAFDAIPNNKGVSFGMPASREGYADFAYNIGLKNHFIEELTEKTTSYSLSINDNISLFLEEMLSSMPDNSVRSILLDVPQTKNISYTETIAYGTYLPDFNYSDGEDTYYYGKILPTKYSPKTIEGWDDNSDYEWAIQKVVLINGQAILVYNDIYNNSTITITYTYDNGDIGIDGGKWFTTIHNVAYDNMSSNKFAVVTITSSENNHTLQRRLNEGVWSEWLKPVVSGLDDVTIEAADTIRLESDRIVEIYSKGGHYYFVSDRFRPVNDISQYLGDSAHRWINVYAQNGTIQTSDRNQKENIEELDSRYLELFNKLTPVSYKFKGDKHDRTHIGFVSQDVKASMDEVGLTDLEFAGYCKDVKTEFDKESGKDVEVLDGNGNPIELYSLRYSEFIALNTRMIQELYKENSELKDKLSDLEQRLSALEENK